MRSGPSLRGAVIQTGFAMYKHLLLATDGSELAGKGVRHGIALAKALNAKASICFVNEFVTALALVAPFDISVSLSDAQIRAAADKAAKSVLDAACPMAAANGVACSPIHVFDRPPADAILDMAAKHACDLIVMSSHGRRGIPRILLGSQAFEVVTRATIPVLIVR